jgi:ABC-type glycerol-3-phosphate transport system substrate-binding protein
MRLVRYGLWLMVALLLGGLIPAAAQDDATRIGIRLPAYVIEQLGEDVFDDFEAEFNAEVVIVEEDSRLSLENEYPEDDVRSKIAFEEMLATSADVVLLHDAGNLSPESVAAGYWLDLGPLVEQDADLQADLLPGVLENVQWDGGTWGLPFAIDPVLLAYDAAAFDANGLEYPNADWTLADLEVAARALTQYDDSGEVVMPGLLPSNDITYILRSLYGQNFYDASGGTVVPDFSDPALVEIWTGWQALSEENLVSFPQRQGGFSFSGDNPPPFQLANASAFFTQAEQPLQPAPLPGGSIGTRLQVFAVSGGTAAPELAYELAKFASGDAEMVNLFFAPFPTRQSVIDVQQNNTFGLEISPEVQNFVRENLPGSLGQADMLFSRELGRAKFIADSEGLEYTAALEQVETETIEAMLAAAELRDAPVVIEPLPEPVVLAPGEVALNFGFSPGGSFIPPEMLQEVADEFVAASPNVALIDVQDRFVPETVRAAEQYDCWVRPLDFEPLTMVDTSLLLSIDPFLRVDPAFDRANYIQTALDEVTQNGNVWALPVSITPQVLFYNADDFAAAGVPEPTDGWTAQEFVEALQSLDTLDPAVPPFQLSFSGGEHLLALIAGYGGGELVDTSTSPPTFRFSAPANAEAIRWVLDLAKDGLIDYRPLFTRGGGGGSGGDVATIQPGVLSNFQLGAMPGRQGANPNRVTTYPVGVAGAVPLNFSTQAGFISANAADPQACYDLIQTFSSDPRIVQTIPADVSLLETSRFQEALSPESLAFYQQYVAQFDAPNTVTISTFSDISTGIGYQELFRAFDRYVMEDVELEAALEEAQSRATDFSECIGDFDPTMITEDNAEEMQAEFEACAALTSEAERQ